MVYVLLADGFEEAEALLPVDILMRGGVDVRLCSVTGKKTVTGTHGITVTAELLPETPLTDAEMLVLPGGMPGAATLDAYDRMTALCDAVLRDGGRLAAICAAPMVLGKRGYLNGRRATAFPGFEKFLYGADVKNNARVVTDGPVTTACGMGAAADFGLELLMLLCGETVCERVKNTAFLSDTRLSERPS